MLELIRSLKALGGASELQHFLHGVLLEFFVANFCVILQGDSMLVTCHYDTAKRTTMTYVSH